MPNIILSNVNYSIDDNHILKDITCTFNSNSITALIGPSGSGKTTLLKLLNGLHSPSSGSIAFDDTSIDNMNLITLRKRAAMALQSAPMLSGNVYDNLNLPKSLFNEKLSQSEALARLKEVDLGQISLKQNVQDLSGGQRQRLSIARTLVNDPDILLLDEITSSLDPASVKEIEALIQKLQKKRQATVIWITHNLQQAARVSERFIMLKQGQVAFADDTKNLFTSSNTAVQKFIAGDDE